MSQQTTLFTSYTAGMMQADESIVVGLDRRIKLQTIAISQRMGVRRRHKDRRVCCKCTPFLAIAIASLHFLLCPFSSATEVQATNEWTLLGDNDTIAAGMHVRLDLEKGERWVKLLDDNQDDEQGHGVQIQADGSQLTVATSANEDRSSDSIVDKNDKRSSSKSKSDSNQIDNMDFEMMHRTLAQLPDEERERLQLPTYVDKTDRAKRKEFEKKMNHIWSQRQDQLRQFELSDLPDLLKERIRQMQKYFDTDSVTRLQLIKNDRHRADNDNAFDPDDIVSVLMDLEYHLTDIDMTRDFHTLGGWPLLVSLLDPQLHSVNATTNSLNIEELILKVDRVQLHAAWCIGSAVKNQEEFHGYATERLMVLHTQQPTTALDLLTEQIDVFNDIAYDFSETVKLQKFIYALGALLRNNRDAQAHFVSINGAVRVGKLLTHALQNDTRLSQRIALRLLALADDVLTDTRLHESASSQVDDAIAKAFTSGEWCNSALQALSSPLIQTETTANAVRAMLPHCDAWSSTSVFEALQNLSETWEKEAADADPDVYNDRLSLIEAVMNEVKAIKR
ncbi:hypothetical protein MPSEU_001068300 [Mayamaea pseudoterrestris]|nr:hypothetical protein MPSEU_001068300 [Mayamaea pseudoterrestris]